MTILNCGYSFLVRSTFFFFIFLILPDFFSSSTLSLVNVFKILTCLKIRGVIPPVSLSGYKHDGMMSLFVFLDKLKLSLVTPPSGSRV